MQGKRRFNRKQILVSVEAYNPLTKETKHISVYQLQRDDLKKLNHILKMMFNGLDFKVVYKSPLHNSKSVVGEK